jgi:hypothetical protein
MATTDTKTAIPSFETAFAQIRDINEQLLDVARKAGIQTLDSYEKAADRAIDLERKLAGVTKQEWLKGLIEAHAGVARELTDAYTSTARSLLK